MPNVSFTISADAKPLLRAYDMVEAAQQRGEKGFEEQARAATRASEATVAAIKKEAQAYELAERQIERSAVRIRGATARARTAATYALAPIQRPSAASRTIARSADVAEYGVGRTDDELFERFLKAESIRGLRRQKRQDAADDEAFATFIRGRNVRQRWKREELAGRLRDDKEFGGKLWSFGKGALGISGIAGATMIADFAVERDRRLQEMGDALLQSEQTFTPLYSVDRNTFARPRIRSEVRQAAEGWGIDAGQITAARFSIESAASNLSPNVQKMLLKGAAEFNKFAGTDMAIAGKALNKYIQNFGTSLEAGGKGVTQAVNRIARAADKGDFEVEDAARYLPDLFSSFKAMGHTDTDALAALAVGSVKGGRMETIATALRNIALRKGDAEKKTGLTLSADFSTAMGQIANFSGPQLKETFGDEAIAMAKALSDAAPELAAFRKELEGIGGSVDQVAQKMSAAWTDTAHATAEVLKSLNEGLKQIDAQTAEDPEVAKDILKSTAARKGAKQAWASWGGVAPDWLVNADALLDQMSVNGEYAGQGIRDSIKKMRASGNDQGAAYASLLFGQETGTFWSDVRTVRQPRGAHQRPQLQTVPHWTGQDEATEFASFQGEYEMTLPKYLAYLSFKNRGNTTMSDRILLQTNRRAQAVAGYIGDAVAGAGAAYTDAAGTPTGTVGDALGAMHGVVGELKAAARVLRQGGSHFLNGARRILGNGGVE